MGGVREIALDADRPAAHRIAHQLFGDRRVVDELREQRVRFETRERFENLLRQDDSDAHQLVRDRNHPEPAKIVAGDDPDVARAASLRARHAGKMREDADVGEARFLDAQRKALRQEPRPS